MSKSSKHETRPLCRLTLGLALILSGACDKNQRAINNAENSRSADARRGVLGDSLDAEQRARLELLGRTSAPTRYTERTDANRLRVVALNFGGADLGQCADASGNLKNGICAEGGKVSTSPELILPLRSDVALSEEIATLDQEIEKKVEKLKLVSGPAEREGIREEMQGLFERMQKMKDEGRPTVGLAPELHAGMFRQFSTQVGMTVETDGAISTVGNTTRVYHSRNFLIIEWRRYRERRLVPPVHDSQKKPAHTYVSAIEEGIAVRVVFDVQLDTIDSELSASFGIADLSVALARNEATVEVSYEVVGTAIDLLPEEAIVITSVNEYLDAFKQFHEAVALISQAWEVYATVDNPGDRTVRLRAKGTENPKEIRITDHHFALAQLAYYVQGPGVGDNFSLIKNADVCQDMQVIEDYLEAALNSKRKQMDELGCFENRKNRKAMSRRDRRELRVLGNEYDVLAARLDDIRTRMAENACQRACVAETRRFAFACGEEQTMMCPPTDNHLLERCAANEDLAVPTKAICKGERKAGERKAGEPKAGEPKAGEPKAGEPKAGETQAGETQAGETQAGEPKPVEPEAGEPKADEPKAGEPKAGEPKAGEPKAGEPKAGERKAGERKAGERKAGEPKAGESKAGDNN